MQPGTGAAGRGFFGASTSNEKPHEVRLEMGQLSDDAGYYAATEENQAFQSEFEQRKVKQDQVLDEIERGLGNLQNIATDVGGELNKQDVLLDEMDERVRMLPRCSAAAMQCVRVRACAVSILHSCHAAYSFLW
jgi:hypothetical protein